MISLSELAQKVGCEKYPLRWEEFYPDVMAEFDKNGTIYTNPEYYQNLHEKYGIFKKYLPLYKETADEVSKSEDLSRFLAVLCRGLQDRQFHGADMASFSAPKNPTGKPNLAYDMFTALAVASEADMCHELLEELNIPADQADYVMNMPEIGIDNYKNHNGGRPGYHLLAWYQLAIDCKLFRLGRLQFELPAKLNAKVVVYRNDNQEEIALGADIALHRSGFSAKARHFEDPEGAWVARIRETATHYVGHPVKENGAVDKLPVALDKRIWKPVLCKDDQVIALHIPPGGGLTPEAVDDSLSQIKEFVARYFPDYDYKAFRCGSWLIDPQLIDMLGEESNISKFNKRFRKVTCGSPGRGVFGFVFLKPGDWEIDIESLPENTTLERKIKEHYLAGKAIYEMQGYFF